MPVALYAACVTSGQYLRRDDEGDPMHTKLTALSASKALALAASLSSFCLAQSAPTTYRTTIYHLKPDMVNEWVDMEKNEVVPALKKAGVKTRNVYVTALFGNAGEYLITQPFDNFSEFDGPSPLVRALDGPGAARLTAKLAKCEVNVTSYEAIRLADISNVLDAPPAVIVSARYRITAGKMAEFRELVKSEILPVYKKAKVTLIVNQRGPGANPADVNMVTGLAKMADLQGGPFLVQQLGQAGADKVTAKFGGVRTLVEVVVRRRVAELSF
jgi:hypothetical protein